MLIFVELLIAATTYGIYIFQLMHIQELVFPIMGSLIKGYCLQFKYTLFAQMCKKNKTQVK